MTNQDNSNAESYFAEITQHRKATPDYMVCDSCGVTHYSGGTVPGYTFEDIQSDIAGRDVVTFTCHGCNKCGRRSVVYRGH